MAGYTRQSVAEIQTGQIVLALPINNEFNALQSAFHATTGHTHDGTTGSGPLINLTNSVSGVLPVARGGFAGIHKITTTAPTVNDDSGDGYAIGSHWIDTATDTVYTATDVTVGAAVWLAQQDYSAVLDNWAAYNSNGLVAQTAQGAWAARTITAPAAGITVTNGNGVSGNPTLALADDLAAVEGLASNGIAVRTGTGTWTVRSVAASGAGLSVSNGDGVSNNPTISLADDVAAIEALASTGIAVRTGASAWAQRSITTSGGGLQISNGSGASGDPLIQLANDVGAIEALGSTGFPTRTNTDTWTQRSMTGTANEITVSNGDGVSGAPTFSLPTALTFTGKTVTGGTFSTITVSSAAATLTGGTISGMTFNNGVIGGVTPAAATFTTLATTGNSTLAGTINLTNDTDLSAISTNTSALIIGQPGVTTSLAFDTNEIWCRNAAQDTSNTITINNTATISGTGVVTGTSSRKLKENFQKIENALEKVCALNGYTFNWKETGEFDTGVIAEEVQEVFPVLTKEIKGNLGVSYATSLGLIIEAIKELKEKLDDISK